MLGPFELICPIGEGGMGAVWKGRHHRSGQEVAIKVLLGQYAKNRRYLEGFHQEVRATAGMDHPGIVTVYDYGLVSPETAAEQEDLHPDSLWLAMEYIRGGSLEDDALRSWPELKSLLLQLLDALAHAHARGLVHRDLKPGNVLFRQSQPGSSTFSWMLTDFGIAHIRDPAVSERTADINALSAGTPLFMAPEQLLSNWRDYGPWTDLYALGCMTFLLVSGRPPFMGSSLMAIALQHINDPIPSLATKMNLPPNFENWIRKLLAKDIAQRYRNCADAAADLLLLGDPEPAADRAHLSQNVPSLESIPTLTFSGFSELTDQSTHLLDPQVLQREIQGDRKSLPAISTRLEVLTGLPKRRHLIPKSWDHPAKRERRTLLAAGKGLFGLRRIPFVGRRNERDRLWEAFRAVAEEERPRAVLITGSAGLGKTRLSDWLATRAEELGLATALRSSHSPILTALDGLPRTFQTYMGATGLNRRELKTRLEEVQNSFFQLPQVDEDYILAMVELMQPAVDGDHQGVPPVLLQTPLERYRLMSRMLSQIAAERPVILTIDDGQWGLESLGFANHLLSFLDDAALPVLILITLREDSLDARLGEREYLEILRESPRSSLLPLEPLEPKAQEELIHEVLGLSPSLVERLRDHTGGNPLFAMQLIESWVQEDLLQETLQGYTLPDRLEFPTTIQDLIGARIARILAGFPSPTEARDTLEIAAALGLEIEIPEWREICAHRSLEIEPQLIDELMIHGLIVPRENGWRFRLPSYRDAIEAISRRDARWESVNRACAEAIASAAQGGACLPERKALHFLSANAPEEALPLLWRAADVRMRQSAYIQAFTLLQMVEECFSLMGLYAEDPRRARAQVLRAEALRYRGELSQARVLLEEILAWPLELPPRIQANGHRVLANLENFSGHPNIGLKHYLRAVDLFKEIGDHRGLARSFHGIGWIRFLRSEVSLSRKAFHRGYDQAVLAGDHIEAAWCLHGIAETYLSQKDLQGVPITRRAVELFEAHGCRSGAALALRTLGDFARWQGRLDEARNIYRRARHFAQSTGHVLATLADALFGFCDLHEELYDSAERRFASLYALPPEKIFPVFRPAAPTGLAVISAHKGDWESFDVYLDILADLAGPQAQLGLDISHFLDQAADLCQDHGELARAQRARDLASRFRPPAEEA